jgi:NADPH-dependent glutamate synthase beta subunit-like oxidoreductase/ferredoxin
MKGPSLNEIPLFIPRSQTSTAVNKTGSWRFLRPKFEEKTAPCRAACPLGQDIPRIEMQVSKGLLEDACQTILAENPFPSVCGRVCFHPCETHCNRANLDDPLAVHRLERFLGDTAISVGAKPAEPMIPTNGKKIAVIGAGPAGLAAAYFLQRLGYACNVFESRAEPGGLLRWGIPTYRLPRQVLSSEIKRIEEQGAVIHCNAPITPKLLRKISGETDALFIACGYGRPIALKIEGGHLAYDGLELLRNIRCGQRFTLNGTAAVIGGGNTAVDVARSLARSGATPLLLYRRRKEDMPAYAPEVDMALKEGVALVELVSPIRIEAVGNNSNGQSEYTLTLQRMKVSQMEIGGRARVIPKGAETEIRSVQAVFSAIGAETEPFWPMDATTDARRLSLTHCRFIDDGIPVVFGGDLTTPLKSVTDAIASGKQAAIALDTYFKKGLAAVGEGIAACQIGAGPALSLETYLGPARQTRSARIVTFEEINRDYFQPESRVEAKLREATEAVRSFEEIEATFTHAATEREAKRCFNCGICNACDFCRLYCPELAVIVTKTERRIDLDYCKGCGICALECPRNAMALEEEIQ